MDENEEAVQNDDERDLAFQEVNAIREALTLAERKSQPITYELALGYLRDISHPRYDKVTSILKGKNESDTVKLYSEMAESLSANGQPTTPLALVQARIDELEILLQSPGKKKHMLTMMQQLLGAKQHFEPRRLSEHRLLEHDAYLATRTNLPKPDVTGSGYQDYKLDKDRRLRIRLIHPDKEETALGTDLVYEQYDLLENRVRFVQMQYKAWSNWSINLKGKSISGQLDKMEKHFCKAGLCNGVDGNRHASSYRLPFCAAFLRPTSPMKSDDSKMVSTGDHVPACYANALRASGKSMRRGDLESNSLSFRVFDELFLSNSVGSKWIPIEQLEKFYADKGLDALTGIIRIHAQEVKIASEEEQEEKRAP